jgi:hypothetical protein
MIIRHARRRLVRIGVTNKPTAQRIGGQVTDAFPWGKLTSPDSRARPGIWPSSHTPHSCDGDS